MGKNKNQFVRDALVAMGLKDETSDDYIRTSQELHKLTIENIIMKKKEALNSRVQEPEEPEEPECRSFMDWARGSN